MGFNPNQLVRHAVLTLNGIGVVIRPVKRGIKVKWADGIVSDVPSHFLRVVDIPKDAKTVRLQDVQAWTAAGKVPEGFDILVFGNEVKMWVGTGWVTIEAAEEKDLGLFPIVTDKPGV